jgi:Tfp pilus assembly protein PilO
MNRLINITLRCSRTVIHAGGAGLLLVVLLTYYYAVHRPLVTSADDDADRSRQLTKLLAASRSVFEENRAANNELSNLTTRINGIRGRIPATALESDYHAALALVAQQEGVQIIENKRGQATTHVDCSELSIQLKCIGDYASICRFVDRIQKLPRIATVSKFTLQTVEGHAQYPVEIGLALYYGLRNGSNDATATKSAEETS